MAIRVVRLEDSALQDGVLGAEDVFSCPLRKGFDAIKIRSGNEVIELGHEAVIQFKRGELGDAACARVNGEFDHGQAFQPVELVWLDCTSEDLRNLSNESLG